jgi:catechol 2,3-dioxygenase-like lactoylglutathione lyase family enzyme
MTVEKISAVTLKVTSMQTSVQFYRDLLGMEVIYGGEHGCFSSLRNDRLIVSTCMHCLHIAAALDPKLLAFVENLHVCPAKDDSF